MEKKFQEILPQVAVQVLIWKIIPLEGPMDSGRRGGGGTILA